MIVGACRTSFHPICAREASHRMEIWGKLGCDDVSSCFLFLKIVLSVVALFTCNGQLIVLF